MAFFPGPAGSPAGRPGTRSADRDHRRRLVHALLSGGGGRADPAGWPVGRDRLALRADGGLHHRALYRVALLRSRLLGVGAGAIRSLVGGCLDHCGGLHRPGVRTVLVIALVVMIMTTRDLDWPTRGRRLALLLIPTAVLAGFATFLYWLTGSWTAWYSAQSTGWVRSLTWPWESFLHTIDAIMPGAFADHPWWAAVFRAEVVAMGLGMLATAWCLVRRMWAEASWVGIQVLAFSSLLLVLLRQSRHVALVPALDDVRSLGNLAAGTAGSADRPSLRGDHGVQRERGFDALVVLALFHRALGELSGRLPASPTTYTGPDGSAVDRDGRSRQPARRRRATNPGRRQDPSRPAAPLRQSAGLD